MRDWHWVREIPFEWTYQGFRDAWQLIASQKALRAQPTDQVIEQALTGDTPLRLFAIEVLGERRAAEAAEPLAQLLVEEQDNKVALRAVGALASIADPSSAQVLIDLARKKDPRFVLQIVYALGAIGGPTATGYLVTVASGHPVEQLRQGAAEALAEIKRRREGPVVGQQAKDVLQ